MGVRDLDEAEDRLCGDRAAVLVIQDGPERDAQRAGEERPAVLAVDLLADLAEPPRQVGLDRLPVGLSGGRFHAGSHRIEAEARGRPGRPRVDGNSNTHSIDAAALAVQPVVAIFRRWPTILWLNMRMTRLERKTRGRGAWRHGLAGTNLENDRKNLVAVFSGFRFTVVPWRGRPKIGLVSPGDPDSDWSRTRRGARAA